MGDNSGGVLLYDFAGIDSVAGEITAFTNQMNQQLAELDREFKQLIADGWHGNAANAFQSCSAKWHQGADNMAQTLQQLSAKVGKAAADMQAADAQNATRFS
jgi:WXG100 family type VII secretion target